MSVKDIMVTGNKLPVVNFSKKISDAIKILNKKNLGLVVITKKNYIKGILTDGDARRSMKYYSSNEKVEKFMTKNPIAVNEDMPASKALSIMNDKKITSLLVYSQKNKKKLKRIVHIHFLLQHGLK